MRAELRQIGVRMEAQQKKVRALRAKKSRPMPGGITPDVQAEMEQQLQNEQALLEGETHRYAMLTATVADLETGLSLHDLRAELTKAEKITSAMEDDLEVLDTQTEEQEQGLED